jgi:hypothetical protein
MGRIAGHLVLAEFIAIFLLRHYGSPVYDVTRGLIYSMMVSRVQIFVSPLVYTTFVLVMIITFSLVAASLVSYLMAPPEPRDEPPA